MKVIASLCFAFLFAAISPAAEPHSPTATGSTESLVTLPRYLVEAIRIAREVGGPDLKLILNEWGNETTQSPRGDAFFALIQALKGEGTQAMDPRRARRSPVPPHARGQALPHARRFAQCAEGGAFGPIAMKTTFILLTTLLE